MIEFQPSDIVACWSPSRMGRVISVATSSLFSSPDLMYGPSHVAMIADHGGKRLWFESTTLCQHPCYFWEEQRNGCQAHEVRVRVRDYLESGGWLTVYRPTRFWRFSQAHQNELVQYLVESVARKDGYDAKGAAWSGTRVFQLSRLFPYADLETFFCSELLCAVLQKLGRVGTDNNPTRFNPARLLRLLRQSGKYEVAGVLRCYDLPEFLDLSPV